MIKTNGYYIDRPRYYEDFLGGGHKVCGFNHKAYYFKLNGEFLRGGKQSKKIKEDFKIEDFIEDQFNKYEIINNEQVKLIFNFGKEWQHEIVMNIYNEDYLFDKDKVLRFIPF